MAATPFRAEPLWLVRFWPEGTKELDFGTVAASNASSHWYAAVWTRHCYHYYHHPQQQRQQQQPHDKNSSPTAAAAASAAVDWFVAPLQAALQQHSPYCAAPITRIIVRPSFWGQLVQPPWNPSLFLQTLLCGPTSSTTNNTNTNKKNECQHHDDDDDDAPENVAQMPEEEEANLDNDDDNNLPTSSVLSPRPRRGVGVAGRVLLAPHLQELVLKGDPYHFWNNSSNSSTTRLDAGILARALKNRTPLQRLEVTHIILLLQLAQEPFSSSSSSSSSSLRRQRDGVLSNSLWRDEEEEEEDSVVDAIGTCHQLKDLTWCTKQQTMLSTKTFSSSSSSQPRTTMPFLSRGEYSNGWERLEQSFFGMELLPLLRMTPPPTTTTDQNKWSLPLLKDHESDGAVSHGDGRVGGGRRSRRRCLSKLKSLSITLGSPPTPRPQEGDRPRGRRHHHHHQQPPGMVDWTSIFTSTQPSLSSLSSSSSSSSLLTNLQIHGHTFTDSEWHALVLGLQSPVDPSVSTTFGGSSSSASPSWQSSLQTLDLSHCLVRTRADYAALFQALASNTSLGSLIVNGCGCCCSSRSSSGCHHHQQQETQSKKNYHDLSNLNDFMDHSLVMDCLVPGNETLTHYVGPRSSFTSLDQMNKHNNNNNGTHSSTTTRTILATKRRLALYLNLNRTGFRQRLPTGEDGHGWVQSSSSGNSNNKSSSSSSSSKSTTGTTTTQPQPHDHVPQEEEPPGTKESSFGWVLLWPRILGQMAAAGGAETDQPLLYHTIRRNSDQLAELHTTTTTSCK
ncbi:hypothetical protein ACA910_018919 [Epithemia clementina (nom. ined.)]